MPLPLFLFILLVSTLQAEPEERTEEFQALLAEAAMGSPAAQIRVGMAFDGGHGVEKDVVKALHWYRQAAAQGDYRGMLQVGYKYEEGVAVEQDRDKAAEWFEKALDTQGASQAGRNLVRLSRAGLIKATYVGIPVEGGFLATKVDRAVPIATALAELAANPNTVPTGKGWLTGFNPQMLSLGARGEQALPALIDFVRNSPDMAVRQAGLLAIYLVGIECDVRGYGLDKFKSRKAREALWELMSSEGLTDRASGLLRRDPWPEDVPAIMKALRQTKAPCPHTLDGLLQYGLVGRPVDLPHERHRRMLVNLTTPLRWSDRDYMELAIEALRRRLGAERVEVEEGLLSVLSAEVLYGNDKEVTWTGSIEDLLNKEIKGYRPASSISTGRGKGIFYHIELRGEFEVPHLCFCGAETAEQLWLKWWETSGREEHFRDHPAP